MVVLATTLRPLWQDLTRASLTRKLPSGISLPQKAGLPTAGRFPHPAPSLGQWDSAPHAPHLVPARGLPHPTMDPWSIYSPLLTLNRC